MIIPYKQVCRKLTMGLLALMPSEKDLRQLQKTITLYETDPAHKLYLWKEKQKIIGVIGVCTKNQKEVILQHLSVLPSFRHQGIAGKMVAEVQQLFPQAVLITNEHTSSFNRYHQFSMPLVTSNDKGFTHHMH
ncbi:GNAT family N-acetyltransferase [Bacillus sp. FJAT-27251]|uniref:GNAT family N-acetyltransferase n=1 Tax=Bacillus sp. FJAT-27251 TaxID=1684142 RepID=UPI000840A8DC|nr:GNAT family N-acetyltransferase [Bacillus sp. FJAT-27251]